MMVCAILALCVWGVLLFARGGFWRVDGELLEGKGSAPGAERRAILAIVPARNEADVLPTTLPALLTQTTSGPFRVLLVDDHSSDGTGALARRLAAECGAADRLTVIEAAPLRKGWTGKLGAMQSGLDHARATGESAERILFTDADIAYGPGALARLEAEADQRGTVLASLMVKLRAESAAERWLIPAFVYFFRMLYPFRWVADPGRRTAAAAGGAMLVDRKALDAMGGLDAIRGSLIDDVAMGTLMKKAGPVWLGLTNAVHSVRAYPAFKDIQAMVVRSAYTELRHSPLRLLIAILGLSLVFLVPPVAALVGDGPARLAGIIAWAAMALSFVPIARFYGVGAWRGLALPGVAALYGVFTVQSAVLHAMGRGGAWKGRVQAATGETHEA
ncbi:glycosyltransferase [Acuticoccus sp. M5D2P5]|uniref:glycosyltransferase n=1 Tax=Acuticoccus kalidii TaxID=2910977 RepID=UPI001F1D13F0|nr:glycosyltransferase [Acuticoccus kalidii]MCF3935832.1 glycosyltransferase [Acuticoccus kalidii]